MLGHGPTFLDATAFDRVSEDFNPYGEYPDGTPCAYCLQNDGEVKPQGWNLVGPICRWCLGQWHRSGSTFICWKRQRAWALAILCPLTDTEGGARPPRNCDLILTGKLEPILQLTIAEYVVTVFGNDDASPRRSQAMIWLNVCRRIQAALAVRRAPPPPSYREPPPHLAMTRYTPVGGHEEHMHDNSSSSSFEID